MSHFLVFGCFSDALQLLAWKIKGMFGDRVWLIKNLAFSVRSPQKFLGWKMCLKIGSAPLVQAFLQPWRWIMTFSCWKWKLCREMVLSAPPAGLELRLTARQARYGIPLPASLLTPLSLYTAETIKIWLWDGPRILCSILRDPEDGAQRSIVLSGFYFLLS